MTRKRLPKATDATAAVVEAHQGMLQSAVRYREACRVQIQWARAKVRADLATELAQAMGIDPTECAWPTALQHVRILVGQSDAARKRRQRTKAPAKKAKAKRRKVKRRIVK